MNRARARLSQARSTDRLRGWPGKGSVPASGCPLRPITAGTSTNSARWLRSPSSSGSRSAPTIRSSAPLRSGSTSSARDPSAIEIFTCGWRRRNRVTAAGRTRARDSGMAPMAMRARFVALAGRRSRPGRLPARPGRGERRGRAPCPAAVSTTTLPRRSASGRRMTSARSLTARWSEGTDRPVTWLAPE